MSYRPRGRLSIKPLSYSQISLYQECPLAYKLQYIDGLKPKDKWYFSFGSTLHLCAQHFFEVSIPPPPSLSEILQFYEENWLSEGYDSPQEEEKYKAYGKQILTEFCKTHRKNFQVPLAVEKQFYIDVEGIKVRGYIDRVDKLKSGGLAIVDYKTSRELFTNEHLAQDLQLTLYQLAAEQTWQLPVEKLTLYHLRSNTPCSCPSRDRMQIEMARRLIIEVAGNITAERFPATESPHCPCDFPEHCPFHRHKYLTVELPQKATVSELAVTNAVEEYVALQRQIKELELQLDELKGMIIQFCQSNDLNRVYGKENAITFKMTERIGFDEDAVRAILEPAGLWDKVLSFDEKKLKDLVTDTTVAREVRDRLAGLKQVISTSTRLWVRKREEQE